MPISSSLILSMSISLQPWHTGFIQLQCFQCFIYQEFRSFINSSQFFFVFHFFRSLLIFAHVRLLAINLRCFSSIFFPLLPINILLVLQEPFYHSANLSRINKSVKTNRRRCQKLPVSKNPLGIRSTGSVAVVFNIYGRFFFFQSRKLFLYDFVTLWSYGQESKESSNIYL